MINVQAVKLFVETNISVKFMYFVLNSHVTADFSVSVSLIYM